MARNTGLYPDATKVCAHAGDGSSRRFVLLRCAHEQACARRVDAVSRSSKIDIAAEATERAERIAKRKMPILGVSEFANLDETLPAKPGTPRGDAAPFEALRLRADALKPAASAARSRPRPRIGFATSFFAAGGFRTRETTQEEQATIVVCAAPTSNTVVGLGHCRSPESPWGLACRARGQSGDRRGRRADLPWQ